MKFSFTGLIQSSSLNKMNAAQNDESLIIATGIVTSALSIVGSLFMIFSYLCVEELKKTHAFRMTFHLGICDLILTLNGFYTLLYSPNGLNPTFCEIWGGLREYWVLTTFLWPFMFGYVLYRFQTKKYTSAFSIQASFPKYLAVCYGVPVIFTILPIIFNDYGNSGLFCWLNSGEGNIYVALAIAIFYVPIFLLGILVIFFYCNIVAEARRNSVNGQSNLGEIVAYPVVFLITVAFAALDRFTWIISANDVIFFNMTHVILRQSQGFLNFIGYGYTRKVRSAMKNVFSKRRNLEEGGLAMSVLRPPDSLNRSSGSLNTSLNTSI